MITLKRTDGSIIAECDTDSMVEAVVMNKSNLRGASLRRADLREADLRGANLRRADLRGANLRRANLRRADLWGANLRRANLRRADLWEADLRRADLREADLWEADLRRADLREANIWEADIREASNILSLGPIGSEGRTIYIVNHGDKIMVHAGCFWGTIDELSAKVNGTHGGNAHGKAYRSAIEFIKSYAKAYKWSEVKDQ